MALLSIVWVLRLQQQPLDNNYAAAATEARSYYLPA